MKKVVFTSGGFDHLHEGHLHLLRECRKLGDYLIVSTNHDAYLARKGPGRPLVKLEARIEALYNTGLVDEVVAIKDSPHDLIMSLKPDVIVVGDDYTIDRVVGANECADWNGTVHFIKRLPGISTTNLINHV
jgi:D-beta-D-heptose 7-phosphate kinase/D-beta-D-heptose 1-phosphate adenosyltransferase